MPRTHKELVEELKLNLSAIHDHHDEGWQGHLENIRGDLLSMRLMLRSLSRFLNTAIDTCVELEEWADEVDPESRKRADVAEAQVESDITKPVKH